MKAKPSGSPFLVVSYYTENTPYEQEADILRGSLHQFGYDHDIVTRPNLGSWVANTCQKAEVIQSAWDQSNIPVVWIDADAIVQKELTVLATLSKLRTDFAAVFATKNMHIRKHKQNAIRSGVLFFNKTDGAEALLRLWTKKCAGQKEWDQWYLKDALDELRHTDVVNLPMTYVKRESKDGYADDEAHILHTRAAAKYRTLIDGGDPIGPT